MPELLTELSKQCRIIIDRAEQAGVVIDNGNVIDLLADNLYASLTDLCSALAIAGPGYGDRFHRAIRSCYGRVTKF